MNFRLFIYLLLFYSIIYESKINAQSLPTIREVSIAVDEIRNQYIEDSFEKSALIDNGSKIKGIAGSFSDKNISECIVGCPMQSGPLISDWVILMKKDNDGNWKYGNWFDLWNFGIKTIDVNSDGIMELILESSYTQMGVTESKLRLISLLNYGKEILYQNDEFDYSGDPFSVKGREPFSRTVKVDFSLIDEKGVRVIMENIKTGYFQSYDKNAEEVRQEYVEENNIYYFENGIYVKN